MKEEVNRAIEEIMTKQYPELELEDLTTEQRDAVWNEAMERAIDRLAAKIDAVLDIMQVRLV